MFFKLVVSCFLYNEFLMVLKYFFSVNNSSIFFLSKIKNVYWSVCIN